MSERKEEQWEMKRKHDNKREEQSKNKETKGYQRTDINPFVIQIPPQALTSTKLSSFPITTQHSNTIPLILVAVYLIFVSHGLQILSESNKRLPAAKCNVPPARALLANKSFHLSAFSWSVNWVRGSEGITGWGILDLVPLMLRLMREPIAR